MTVIHREQHMQIANAYFSGRATVVQLANRYGTTDSRIYQIVRKYRKQARIPGRHGPHSCKARTVKLSERDVTTILSLQGKATAVEVAEAANVSPSSIYKIWEGRTWKSTYNKFYETEQTEMAK